MHVQISGVVRTRHGGHCALWLGGLGRGSRQRDDGRGIAEAGSGGRVGRSGPEAQWWHCIAEIERPLTRHPSTASSGAPARRMNLNSPRSHQSRFAASAGASRKCRPFRGHRRGSAAADAPRWASWAHSGRALQTGSSARRSDRADGLVPTEQLRRGPGREGRGVECQHSIAKRTRRRNIWPNADTLHDERRPDDDAGISPSSWLCTSRPAHGW